MTVFSLGFFALAVSFAPSATAASIVAMSFTGGSVNNFTAPAIVGHGFQVNQNITVTELGMYDFAGDGMSTAQDVGLFTDAGALLAQVSIQSGTASPLTSGFRYEAISPIMLSAGQTYRLLGHRPTNDDPHIFNGAVTTVPEITLVQGYVGFSPSFQFTTATTASLTNFGPNFKFVPEPSSVTLAAIGLVGLAAYGWRRRKRWRGTIKAISD